MTAQTLNIGDLNRRLVLEVPAESDDGAGGVTRLYDVVTTLWAQVTPLVARGETVADSLGASSRYRIVIRMRAGITTQHRFQDGTRIYRVVALRDNGDGRFLEIDADVRED
jgi:SPP1 family predicted phage head-tail adaptor